MNRLLSLNANLFVPLYSFSSITIPFSKVKVKNPDLECKKSICSMGYVVFVCVPLFVYLWNASKPTPVINLVRPIT